jgi:hypothetical protein
MLRAQSRAPYSRLFLLFVIESLDLHGEVRIQRRICGSPDGLTPRVDAASRGSTSKHGVKTSTGDSVFTCRAELYGNRVKTDQNKCRTTPIRQSKLPLHRINHALLGVWTNIILLALTAHVDHLHLLIPSVLGCATCGLARRLGLLRQG